MVIIGNGKFVGRWRVWYSLIGVLQNCVDYHRHVVCLNYYMAQTRVMPKDRHSAPTLASIIRWQLNLSVCEYWHLGRIGWVNGFERAVRKIILTSLMNKCVLCACNKCVRAVQVCTDGTHETENKIETIWERYYLFFIGLLSGSSYDQIMYLTLVWYFLVMTLVAEPW